ncbi:hypothetical protein EXIGLDRAFT_324506 [Exidia glandulosa HHB12029]|uniref:Uncharacterized protein n=1 Tax=Exidia glandulosa HHB12029 TaxID=1314781 RepID=A0A165CUK1_EXIGL|nr:hypothetical protein EXIGLDRAFT_324506 [Exidia glandulosa HHB12029]
MLLLLATPALRPRLVPLPLPGCVVIAICLAVGPSLLTPSSDRCHTARSWRRPRWRPWRRLGRRPDRHQLQHCVAHGLWHCFPDGHDYRLGELEHDYYASGRDAHHAVSHDYVAYSFVFNPERDTRSVHCYRFLRGPRGTSCEGVEPRLPVESEPHLAACAHHPHRRRGVHRRSRHHLDRCAQVEVPLVALVPGPSRAHRLAAGLRQAQWRCSDWRYDRGRLRQRQHPAQHVRTGRCARPSGARLHRRPRSVPLCEPAAVRRRSHCEPRAAGFVPCAEQRLWPPVRPRARLLSRDPSPRRTLSAYPRSGTPALIIT